MGPDLERLLTAFGELIDVSTLGIKKIFLRSVLPPGKSAKVSRQTESALARKGEQEICKEFLSLGVDPTAVLTSVTHSQLWVLVVGFAPKTSVQSMIEKIGVDMELSSRKITDRLCERFVHTCEKQFPLQPIDFWVIKEACFKADTGYKSKLVTHYQIGEFSVESGLGVAENTKNQNKLHFCFLRSEGWSVAFALRKTIPQNQD